MKPKFPRIYKGKNLVYRDKFNHIISMVILRKNNYSSLERFENVYYCHKCKKFIKATKSKFTIYGKQIQSDLMNG